jgi:TM2 domain-containing membrane protein YozV
VNRSDQLELVYAAQNVFHKAYEKYQEVLQEISDEEKQNSNLVASINDSVLNLNRKIKAHLNGRIDINKLLDEFVFEKGILIGELDLATDAHPKVKRLTKRILESIEEFLDKAGAGKKSLRPKRLKDPSQFKSKKIAYLLWLIGMFGTLGFQRFYLEKYGTGIGWFMTGGAFFAGSVYDLFTLGKQVKEHNDFVETKFHELRQSEKKHQITGRTEDFYP